MFKSSQLTALLLSTCLSTFAAQASSSSSLENESVSKVQRTHVPSTVSPEGQGVLKYFDSLGHKLTIEFDHNDLGNIKAVKKEKADLFMGMSEAAIKQYNPTIIRTQLGDVPVLDIRPQGWQDAGVESPVVVFFHGGGYVFNTADCYQMATVPLADKLKARVISVDYTTAPFKNYIGILQEAWSVVEALRRKGHPMEKMVLAGDSSGGGLAAALAKSAGEGYVSPAALILWSPWLDVTRAGDTKVTLDDHEPVLDQVMLDKCALSYAPKSQHTNPLVSPVYADFQRGDYPPTLIQGGTKEIFLSDWVRFARNAEDATEERESRRLIPMDVKLDLYEGMTHCFHIFNPDLPESQKLLASAKRFFDKHVKQPMPRAQSETQLTVNDTLVDLNTQT